jgi:hypothetical protein
MTLCVYEAVSWSRVVVSSLCVFGVCVFCCQSSFIVGGDQAVLCSARVVCVCVVEQARVWIGGDSLMVVWMRMIVATEELLVIGVGLV